MNCIIITSKPTVNSLQFSFLFPYTHTHTQSSSTPKQSNGKQDTPKMNGNAKLNGSAGNTPFRRVREEEVEIDERVKNNSFEAKVSSELQLFLFVYYFIDENTLGMRI